MDPKRLKARDDSRKNWRTINDVMDRLSALEAGNRDRQAAVAELRRRRRDVQTSS